MAAATTLLHCLLFADRAQRTSGKASGFSQQYISSLEQGQRNPTVITLYELAVALGVSHRIG
jgi:transcriptional regulator with XRE-family HTH domain